MRSPAGWRSGNDIAIGAAGLGFDSPADQIGHSATCYRCDASSVLPRCKAAEIGPANLLHVSAYYGEYNKGLIF